MTEGRKFPLQDALGLSPGTFGQKPEYDKRAEPHSQETVPGRGNSSADALRPEDAWLKDQPGAVAGVEKDGDLAEG